VWREGELYSSLSGAVGPGGEYSNVDHNRREKEEDGQGLTSREREMQGGCLAIVLSSGFNSDV